MRENISIPQRLKAISTFLSTGTTFADIGSDHALLPTYVCLNDPKAEAIAGEVNRGPYHSATQTVERYNLNDVIDVRLGDGLDILREGEIKELVIAGMGGTLLTSILEKGKSKIESVNRIIVQPNVNEKMVRQWLNMNYFNITEETIIKEHGHIYEIIVGDRVYHRTEVGKLSRDEQERQFMFGPILLKNKSAIDYEKWTEERRKLSNVIDQMNQAKVKNESKMKQFVKELKWMEEVLE